MDYYSALSAELTNSKYADLSDADAATLLNANTVQIYVDIPVSEVESYLRIHGKMTALEDWVDGNTTPSVARTFARELVGIISGKIQTFRTSLDSTRITLQTLFSALVAASAGSLVQADSDAIFALALGPMTSRAEQLGLGTVGEGDVARARSQ